MGLGLGVSRCCGELILFFFFSFYQSHCPLVLRDRNQGVEKRVNDRVGTGKESSDACSVISCICHWPVALPAQGPCLCPVMSVRE